MSHLARKDREATLIYSESPEGAYTSRRGTGAKSFMNCQWRHVPCLRCSDLPTDELPPTIRLIAQGWKETISLIAVIVSIADHILHSISR